MNTWDTFKKTINKYGLIKSGDRILVALSGGPDSVCLTHLLWRLQKSMPLKVFAVYFDHGLRKQSKKEMRFVERFGAVLGIEVIIKKIPVRGYAQENKLSIETAGRNLRYHYLDRLAQQYRCSRIATGHTANDNAETMLMWLMRGTGTEGLRGIPLERTSSKKRRIIRPLLSITKQDVLQYIKSQKISYCIDASNNSFDFMRNKIRHTAIPLFTKYNPSFILHMYRLSRIVSDESEYLQSITRRAIQKSVKTSKNKIMLDLKRFFGYNITIQSRIIKSILPEKRSHIQVERLLHWIYSKNRTHDYSKKWTVSKTSNKLIFKSN